MRRKRFSTLFIFVIFSILAFGNTEPRDSDVVEGSGARPSNKNVVAADIDWEASGVGPDDEDGDVVEGSGSPPLNQKHDAVEGSGLPPAPKKPVITPDDPFPKKEEKGVEEEEKPKTTIGVTTGATTLPPVATTLITINKAETKPISVIVTDSPKVNSDTESDTFQNMLQPGILAAITGGAVVGILLAILLIMFIIYRIRKKDEGSYSVDENSHHPPHYSYAYQKAATQEFYA
ncbi:hypothetical protein FO519_004743 [Halicephalobus sp. NKZ332]|nr:hypothetical protein FO519_004743 [Halicephalobus sp. NKZ332]